jgi:putative FmdB family regulatory protein
MRRTLRPEVAFHAASIGAMMLGSGGKTIMSEYVFHCQDCNKEFTQSLHMADREKGGITCPHCGSKRVEQMVTAFSAVTAKKS